MKAVVFEKYGPPEVLHIKEVPKPKPQADEVLVKIKATAVNAADVRVRGLAVPGFMKFVMRVVLGIRGPRKKILGVVFAGVVEKTGENVKSYKAGDAVYASTGFAFGGYAEYAVIKESAPLALKPKKASFEQAAALPFGGSTSLYFLRKAGIATKRGQKVLIYGSSGAVGTAAVQIAKHYGAEVTAVCSTEGVKLAKSLGADYVIDYKKEDVTKNSKVYDIIFETVGKKKKSYFGTVLKLHGKFVTTGSLDVATETKEQLLILRDLYQKGEFKAVIDKTFPLAEIVKAHRYVDQEKKKGNVIITVN